MRRNYSSRSGFTIIELLVVIAIIAILAALLFPVFSSAKERGRQAQCITQLHDISVAVALYHTDNERYPASLRGFANGKGGALYGSAKPYLKDLTIFTCPDSKGGNAPRTAVYPLNTPLAGQTAVYTPQLMHAMNAAGLSGPIQFYPDDDYDSGLQIDANGKANGIVEVHYSLDWTGVYKPTDNPNQLKYNNPPAEHTVVSWCTNHVTTAGTDNVIVLMLDGAAKAMPRTLFFGKGPLGAYF